MLSQYQYPLNVMKSWIVWEEKWCPCDTNTTWNIRIAIAINFIRWIHHFKHKVSSHLFGRLEQAVTIRMSILLMLQLISHSLQSQHSWHFTRLPPGLLTTEPYYATAWWQYRQMGISPLENTYSIVFYCVMWCVWRVSEFILLGFKIFCILCFSPR